jgi:hypothetical protein
MDLFDTLTWAEILVKTTFLDTPTLTVPCGIIQNHEKKTKLEKSENSKILWAKQASFLAPYPSALGQF